MGFSHSWCTGISYITQTKLYSLFFGVIPAETLCFTGIVARFVIQIPLWNSIFYLITTFSPAHRTSVSPSAGRTYFFEPCTNGIIHSFGRRTHFCLLTSVPFTHFFTVRFVCVSLGVAFCTQRKNENTAHYPINMLTSLPYK
jgi:hypothetical protein